MTISPEERSYRRLAKVGARKKNPTDSVRATVIIPKKEYDLLSVIAKEQCRSVSAQALFFIQRAMTAQEMEDNNGNPPT
jgi:hypothetical protein